MRRGNEIIGNNEIRFLEIRWMTTIVSLPSRSVHSRYDITIYRIKAHIISEQPSEKLASWLKRTHESLCPNPIAQVPGQGSL
jgi:hypothetical protein